MGVNPIKRSGIFLDRDGVLNKALMRGNKPYPPTTLAEVEILSGVKSAIEVARYLGYHVAVVTNQPDVARGKSAKSDVEEINRYIGSCIAVEDFRVCYHDDADACACRKPLPGMIIDVALENNLDLSRSFLVGDRWRDIAAGHAAGCTTFFIDYGYDERPPNDPDYVVRSLEEAMLHIKNLTFTN